MAADAKTSEELTILSKRLGENTVVFAQSAAESDKERHSGILIGNIGEESLLIGGFEVVHFSIGEKIIIRMVLGSYLVGFESEVEKKFESSGIYVVKFPLKIESINLRKTQRIQAFFPADVTISTPGSDAGDIRMLKTRIVDISTGGCEFRSKTKMKADTEVHISFSLPGDHHIQSVNGIVLESNFVGNIFTNRVKFIQEGGNVPIIQEISRWISESLSFTSEFE